LSTSPKQERDKKILLGEGRFFEKNFLTKNFFKKCRDDFLSKKMQKKSPLFLQRAAMNF